MFENIKCKLKLFFFEYFVKPFYTLVSESQGIEKVYGRKDRLIILVEDETIGKRLYTVLRSMIANDVAIYAKNLLHGEVISYIADKEHNVKMFSMVHVNFENYFEVKNLPYEETVVIASIVDSMKKDGYYLEASCFDRETCMCLSSFLSCLVTGSEHEASSDRCLMEYIHWMLSGGEELQSFYEPIISENRIYRVSDFQYSVSNPLPLVQLFYYYYCHGKLEESIAEVLFSCSTRMRNLSDEDCYEVSNLLVSNTDLSNTLKIIEDTGEYTCYEGNYQIFKDMPLGFERFLRDKSGILKANASKLICKIKTNILDYTGHVVGYKLHYSQEVSGLTRLKEGVTFNRQSSIFNFIRKLSTFLSFITLDGGDFYEFDYYRKIKQKPFDISNLLVAADDNRDANIKIANPLDLFYIICTDEKELKRQVTQLFFKIYLEFIKKKYGELKTNRQFLKQKEIKYLRPILAREFIHFALGKQVNVEEATTELYDFLNQHDILEEEEWCDSRMGYNPNTVSFVFDYEAEEKYGMKIQAGITELLPDGRRIITFKRKTTVSKVKVKIRNSIRQIYSALGEIEDENVKIINISEIIYSQYISKDGEYLVSGIVTTPVSGSLLTDVELLCLNNKQLYQMVAYLLTKFNDWAISLDSIWRDADNHFVIDFFQEGFKLIQFINQAQYVKEFVSYLSKIRYNPYAIVLFRKYADWCYNKLEPEKIKSAFIRKADKMSFFCQEHKIYYWQSATGEALCPICKKLKTIATQGHFDSASKFLEDNFSICFLDSDGEVGYKVYKESMANELEEIEENIDAILLSRLLQSKEPELLQECFIPAKKLVDSNSKFIGFIYKMDKANEEQDISTSLIDLKSPKLKNLPRLKALIRLLMQVRELIDRKLYFSQNPFSHVFLSKYHKKQVQIFGIEFLGKQGKKETTIGWLYEYVKEVIDSDSTIKVDLSDCSANIELILKRLQSIVEKMTRYCPIHNTYYSNEYWVCPLCIGEEQLKELTVEKISSDAFADQEEMNEGGESFIYPYKKNSVAKIFKSGEVNCDVKSIVIARVLQRKKVFDELNKQNNQIQYIIPQSILLDDKSHQLMGYTMRQVKEGKPISLLRDTEQIKRLHFTRRDVLEVLITIGEGIEALHSKANIYIGDLNGRNILFDSKKRVYFLDFDGMGVDEFAPVFCTDGYIDPASKKNQNISPKDDWYSFAIQAFYYLTFTHPFNGIYYGEVEGRKVLLDIVDKMEQRISLLGNHGMEPPDVAVLWDWMTNDLKHAFLSIFEGENRESIVPYLKEQYEKMYGGDDEKTLSIFLVNPKFIATQERLWEDNIVRVINSFSAICQSENMYLSIQVTTDKKRKQYHISVDNPDGVREVLLSSDGQLAFIITNDCINAFLLNEGRQIYKESFTDNMHNFVVNGSSLYSTSTGLLMDSMEGNYIYRRNFKNQNEVETERINFFPEQQIKAFLVKVNSKFVVVKHSGEGIDTVYCNNTKLCDIECKDDTTAYKVLYDNTSGWWLVINSEGNGVIFTTSSPEFYRFSLPEEVTNFNVDTIFFYKKKIYLPSKSCLYIVSYDGQAKFKKMECRKIMTPTSRICSINPDGFSVITDGKLYRVCKKGGIDKA